MIKYVNKYIKLYISHMYHVHVVHGNHPEPSPFPP